ncbi:MAG: DUF6512 family protein [Candidatus Saccharibacteria bacterium]|nr:DUF6512 family protein [Candidatus Saccharibacteria bacterium]
MLEIIGAVFIIVVGCLNHFVYDWTRHNKFVGYFAAVNESTWEHLKLVVFPTLAWMLVEYHFYSGNPNFFFARFMSLFAMISIIPIIFYTYTRFTKKPILIVDILSFIVAIVAGQAIFYGLIQLNVSNMVLDHIGIVGLIIIFFTFMMNTYAPAKEFLLEDPTNHKYGIKAHSHKHNK